MSQWHNDWNALATQPTKHFSLKPKFLMCMNMSLFCSVVVSGANAAHKIVANEWQRVQKVCSCGKFLPTSLASTCLGSNAETGWELDRAKTKSEWNSTLCCNRSSAFSSIIASLRLSHTHTYIAAERCLCEFMHHVTAFEKMFCMSFAAVSHNTFAVHPANDILYIFLNLLFLHLFARRRFRIALQQFVSDQTKEHRLRTYNETKENHTHKHT